MTNQNLATAAQLAPIVERVHGAHHPELTRVRQLTMQLQQPANADRAGEIYQELRAVTSNYAIPSDVCEAFVATYQALEQADRARAA